MELNTKQNQPVKINLNLGKLVGSIHVANSPDPKVFPSPETISSIFQENMPRIMLQSLIKTLETVNWDVTGGDVTEVNVNVDQLIEMIRFDTEKAYQNEPVKVPNVDQLVDTFMNPLPERKPKSPLQVYPRSSRISEHGIREREITKQKILQRVENILNKATDGDEFERTTIYLRLSVDLQNPLDASQ